MSIQNYANEMTRYYRFINREQLKYSAVVNLQQARSRDINTAFPIKHWYFFKIMTANQNILEYGKEKRSTR